MQAHCSLKAATQVVMVVKKESNILALGIKVGKHLLGHLWNTECSSDLGEKMLPGLDSVCCKERLDKLDYFAWTSRGSGEI